MKLIIAIIKPQKLDDVYEALNKVGIDGMTVSDVRGYGRQKGHSEVYRGTEYQVDFIPKLKMEIAVPETKVSATLTIIQEAAKTGRIGDGKIFVVNLEEAVRVRTGEVGQEALG